MDHLYNMIQYNKQFILLRISDKIVTQMHITSLNHLTFINLYHVCFINNYVFNFFVKTAKEGAVFMLTGRELYSMGAASEMTCHLHIFVMSGELATGVDLYTIVRHPDKYI